MRDERERDSLRQQIQSLEKANRRRKALAFFFLTAFGLFLTLGMGTVFTGGGKEEDGTIPEANSRRDQADSAAVKKAANEVT